MSQHGERKEKIMAGKNLEERVAELEQEIAALKTQVAALLKPNDWRSVAGMFEGDEVMKRILDNARKIREADRRRTRPKASKSKRQTQP
jgi:regulator of replication initiation timing